MRRLQLILFGLFPLIAFSQTFEEKQAITRDYNIEKLTELATSFQSKAEVEKEKAIRWANQNDLPVKFEEDGKTFELMKLSEDGKPIYYTTFNVDAAESSRANTLHDGGLMGLDLEGQNMEGHVWDAGLARSTHQEYDGVGGSNRFSIGDGTTTLHYHSAHVTGTVIASGFEANAKGMAPQAEAIGYEWNNDMSEAITAAANGMLLSNHSYGWRASLIPDWYFGAYLEESRDWDEILYNAPYYLMVVAAGNDGNDNSSNGNPLNGNSSYDKLSGHATSKNNLVVANAQDANIDEDGNLVSVIINTGSSEGPTDDFRIKPDITGNGTGLYSSYETADNAYNTISGTSMASPNVMGTLLLLQQHYNDINSQFMTAATLKGLAMHTADDAGIAGPDAVWGWGLINGKEAAEVITNNGNESIIFELTMNQGNSFSIDVDSDGVSALLSSISWTDPAGTANVGTANDQTPVLVNDLDVRITQGSNTYFPFKLVNVNANGTGDNQVDPFENIQIDGASGSYTITVTHKGVLASGSQDFSLIVSGLGSDLPPQANFSADNTLPVNTTTTVSFTNLSTSSPTSYQWSFDPATVNFVGGTDANSSNPQVQFNNIGAYAVSLYAQNGFGNDTKVKTEYIHVGTPGLWTGESDQIWNSTGNWHNAMIPLADADIVIPSSATNWPIHTGDLTLGTDCQSLTLENGTEITLTGDLVIPSGHQVSCEDQASIFVEGDWLIYGTFIPGNSQVTLQGGNTSNLETTTTASYSLGTTLINGNGSYGNMFDLVAINELTISSFEANLTEGSGDVSIYYKSGTWVGSETNASAWTFVGSDDVASLGEGQATPISVAVGITIPAGETYAFYIHTSNGIRYTNGTTVGNVFSSDDNIQFLEGCGKPETPFTAVTYSPRIFNGIIHYSVTVSGAISFHDLIINKNLAEVQNNADINVGGDLEINSGAWLTNYSPKNIAISGDLTIRADASSMGSFIDEGTTSVTGNSSVQQYLSSERYHLVSSPIEGSTVVPYTGIYLAAYNEPTGDWTYLVNTSIPMNTAAGYSAWASDDITGPSTVSFNGPLQNSDFYIDTLTYTSSQAPYDGFALLGNPYPSALDWNNSWSMSNMSGWMQVYDNGTYKGWHTSGTGYNGKTDGIIPPGQGFWVRTSNIASNITIPASERTHSAQAFYKNTSKNEFPIVRISSSINGFTDETGIIFHPESTTGFDSYFDLTKFSNVSEAPQLFSMTQGGDYAMNFYGSNYLGEVIPIGFTTETEGVYTISASEQINFEDGTEIWIEDIKEGIWEILLEGVNYHFNYKIDDDPHRFNLHFTNATLGLDKENSRLFRVWSFESILYIDNQRLIDAKMEAFDILGKKIFSKRAITPGLNRIQLNVNPGYYLIRIGSEDGIQTTKVFLD